MPKAANLTVDGYVPRYFMINGDGSPTDDLVTVQTGKRLLLRLVNAGLQNRAPQLVGGTFEIVAEDGHATPVSHQQYNTLLPAGKALDLLFVAPAPGTYTLYDRRLGLSNGSGQLGHIVVTP
jgi:FtsP/CotA-like multicopper oxidase with cupredoxin domain